MKQLHGAASDLADASIEACFAVVEAVERYPEWHPRAVRSVDVLERDSRGRASTARTTLHVSRGPVSKDFEMVVAVVAVAPRKVTLTRVANEPSDREEFEVRWSLEAEEGATRIGLEIDALLAVPRLLPLAGIGDATARAFVAAAVAALLAL
jgi:ribosome-associated toxin RatA of RatAB toxin-antitoxin module